MKKVLALVSIILLASVINVFSQSRMLEPTYDASPVITWVGSGQASKAITLPTAHQKIKNVTVMNYDSADGCWINWSTDTDTLPYASQSNRMFLGANSSVTLNDFVTTGITVFRDLEFTSGTASPIVVIITY